jgi:hypothetical protein|tara:strand:- start:2522 stop:2827 length:306 start_codon:yes stop_codon:yes gene_type:complete
MSDLPDFEEWDNSDTNKNNQEFEINNSVESIAFIEQLKTSSKEMMFELIYKAIIENEMGALKNNSPKEEKIAALETVVRFFAEKEEYERCHELKKIISKIC